MDQNPYQPPQVRFSAATSPKSRATRWLVCLGVTSLLLAGLCFFVTLWGMLATFNTISTSSTELPASQVADGISRALLPSMMVGPLGLLGIVLLILGWLFRRQVGK